MGEWNAVFEDEVEGRLVTIKVYRSDEPADEDEGPAVRVTTTSVDDYPDVLEQDGDTLLLEREDAGRLITLEPDSLDDLEGELMGFRRKFGAGTREGQTLGQAVGQQVVRTARRASPVDCRRTSPVAFSSCEPSRFHPGSHGQ